MRKLTVLIDMDDTIEDLVPAWIDYINKKFNTSVRPEDISEWNMEKFFPDVPASELYGALEDEALWRSVRPKPGAVEYVEKIINDGHTVHIVTSSAYKTIVPKMELVLFAYFPYITWNNVIITSNKQKVRGNVLIDDGVHNHIGGKYFSILMDATHNQWFNTDQSSILRVKDWVEAYNAVCSLAR